MRHAIKKHLRNLARHFTRRVAVHVPVLQSTLLENRVALVTGATSGIGRAIAEAFVQSGAAVVVAGRSSDRVHATCAEISGANPALRPGQVVALTLDVSRPATHELAIDGITTQLDGRAIDILVNNAGTLGTSSFGRVSEAEYDSILDTNLRGTYFLSQLLATRMVRARVAGNILNIASSSSLRPATSPYTLSKWAMRGLTLGLAKTLIPFDIVVNGLAPGPTATKMLGREACDDIELMESPSGRYATPTEVAQMAVVLVSGLGRMVVGDTLYMTGGAGVITFDDMKYDISV